MSPPPLRVVVDTGMGVDDALAITWLLRSPRSSVEVVGLSTTWGNTSVEQATRNARALLAALGRTDLPIAVGSPYSRTGPCPSLGFLTHGRDGLWGRALGDAPHPGPVRRGPVPPSGAGRGESALLALGPMTNLAVTLARDPEALAGFTRIVVSGGAWRTGGVTPVAEGNVWSDPSAAHEVLSAGLPVTLVTRDAHNGFTLDDRLLAAIRSDTSMSKAKPPTWATRLS